MLKRLLEKRISPITEKRIRRLLPDKYKDLPIFVYKKTDSTNTRAKEYAENFGNAPAVFIADLQTAGRGRLGRSFYSPKGHGLYISFLLRPEDRANDALMTTAYAAVVMSDTLKAQTELSPRIKWVNDIICGEKKLAGILTVGSFSEDGDRLSYAICGIGVNVTKASMPEELSLIATSIEEQTGRKYDRCSLAAHLIDAFLSSLHTVGTNECCESYRSYSLLPGKRVKVEKKSCSYEAEVLGISDRFELILKLDSGETEFLSTGEVSVRFR